MLKLPSMVERTIVRQRQNPTGMLAISMSIPSVLKKNSWSCVRRNEFPHHRPAITETEEYMKNMDRVAPTSTKTIAPGRRNHELRRENTMAMTRREDRMSESPRRRERVPNGLRRRPVGCPSTVRSNSRPRRRKRERRSRRRRRRRGRRKHKLNRENTIDMTRREDQVSESPRRRE